jgi:hypothetical protein
MLPDVLHECETWETCGHHGSEDGDVAPLRCYAGTYLKSSWRHNPEEQHRRCEHCLLREQHRLGVREQTAE